jgi:anti-anti-sigma factor
VKLHFNNRHSLPLAQPLVNGSARRGGGDYGTLTRGMPGRRWPLRYVAQRAAPSANIQPDSYSPGGGKRFMRRTSLEIDLVTRALRVNGIRKLNQTNALALRERVKAVLSDKVKSIELDLSQTMFLDRHGLAALIALRNMMGRRRGVVRLLNPSPLVEQILELTRLHRVLDIVKCELSLAG